ncbi:MAG: DUF3108 domain-containing protein [Proteobacteria bacterium]|nr:DUF3108 domain-containing protein [Pseudomonadota bacterium]
MITRKQGIPCVRKDMTPILRTAVTFLTLLLLVQLQLQAQSIFSAGETLRYKVRWSFIRLGTVEIRQCSLDPRNPAIRQFEMSVKSASGLPFIDLDFTQMTTATLDPLEVKTVTIDTRHGNQVKTTYWIESATQQLIVTDSCQGAQIQCDTIAIAERCYEALSLLLVARSYASATKTMVISTLVGGTVGETVLDFTGETEEIDVPALDDPVEAFHFSGDARWVGRGFAGMKGKFKGWISRDAAAVPLRAEVGIFLGSIVLELESIDRPNWRPSDTASSTLFRTR